jgi:hypothetical protein
VRRKGRYNVARLIERHGADAKMTYLRAEIPQCAKADLQRLANYHDFCGARWVVKCRNP